MIFSMALSITHITIKTTYSYCSVVYSNSTRCRGARSEFFFFKLKMTEILQLANFSQLPSDDPGCCSKETRIQIDFQVGDRTRGTSKARKGKSKQAVRECEEAIEGD